MRPASLLTAILAPMLVLVAPADARRTAGVAADVVKHEKTADGATLITVSRGLDHHIAKTSRCELYNAKADVVPGDCTIVRVDKTQTVVKTHAKLTAAIRVQFWF